MLRWAYQADATVLTASGTQALQLAIQTATRLAGVAAAPVVALPAFTCFDVATAAVGAGARIALYDVDPATLAPDLDSLRAVLDEGVRVVVVTPLYGLPVAWQEIEDAVMRAGAVVVEDAAQGQGARWRGRTVGTFGAISVVSFGRGKGWTGCGGGALLVRGRAIAAVPDVALRPASRAREFSTAVSALGQWWLGRPAWYALPASLPFLALGETRYHDPQPPAEMSRAAAALALHTRPQAVLEALARRLNAAELLAGLPSGVAPVRPIPGADASFIRLPVRLPGGLASFDRPAMALRAGVGRSYPSTLATLPAVRARLTGPHRQWPGAETLVRELVTLPTHSHVAPRDRLALTALLPRQGMTSSQRTSSLSAG